MRKCMSVLHRFNDEVVNENYLIGYGFTFEIFAKGFK